MYIYVYIDACEKTGSYAVKSVIWNHGVPIAEVKSILVPPRPHSPHSHRGVDH